MIEIQLQRYSNWALRTQSGTWDKIVGGNNTIPNVAKHTKDRDIVTSFGRRYVGQTQIKEDLYFQTYKSL